MMTVRGLLSRLSLAPFFGAFLLLSFSGFDTSAQGFGGAFSGFQTGNDQPIQIQADSLEVKDAEKLAIFKGNVDVQQGETVMKAARLHVYYTGSARPGSTNQQGISRIEATGKIWVNSGENTATGDRAVLNMETQIVVLSGNVVLTQCNNVIRGESLRVNLANGQAQLSASRNASGRVQGLFAPGQGGAPNTSATGCE